MRARNLTLGTVIAANAGLHAGKDALVDGPVRISHRELELRTNRLARVLMARGIARGDRVALLLPDSARFVELLIATAKIGAIAVLLNWRLSPGEIAWIDGDCDTAAICYAERFAGLVPQRSGLATIPVADDPLALARYEHWATDGCGTAFDNSVTGIDPLFMMFTSGTTGRPKGCLHSHEGTVLTALSFAARHGMSADDRNLSVNPLFHVAGLGQLLSVLVPGGANCFVDRDAGPVAPIEIAIHERCTRSTIAQPLMQARQLAGPEAARKLGFRTITGGAGMADPSSFAYVQGEWNATLIGGWGQTESWGFATSIAYPQMLEHPRSVGSALPHVSLAILDERGQPHADPDAIGEFGVRGPNVMLGYWRNPEASEAALGTGWLRTGDLMRRDELGLYTMHGRAKELIKSGGENVYPVEVETILKALPGVRDAAIAGVADSRWGEAVKAFVVLEPGATFDPAAMTAACRASIAGYKRPRYLEVVDEIPKDYAGKVRRYQLSARAVTADQVVD